MFTAAAFPADFADASMLLASPTLHAVDATDFDADLLMPLSPNATYADHATSSMFDVETTWSTAFDSSADGAQAGARAWSPDLLAPPANSPATSLNTLDMMDLSRFISGDFTLGAAAPTASLTTEPLAGLSDCRLHGADAAGACRLASAGCDSPCEGGVQSYEGGLRGHGGHSGHGQCSQRTPSTAVVGSQQPRDRRAFDEGGRQRSEHGCCCGAGEECRRLGGKRAERDGKRAKRCPAESRSEWSRRRDQRPIQSRQQRAC